MERMAHRGRLWKIFGTISARNWGVFYSQEGMDKEDSSGRRSRKARRNTRPVATIIFLQRSFGASQKKCGYRLLCPDDASHSQCRKVGQLGKRQRGMQGPQEADDKVAMEDIGRPSIAQDI